MVTDASEMGNTSLVSMLDPDFFKQQEFYGAEAVFIRNEALATRPENPGIIDFDACKGDSIFLGYIYGGIKAYSLNPGGKTGGADSTATGYGRGRSEPTNALWKVYFTTDEQD